MKKIVLISAIVSSTLLIIGGTFFAIGIVNETKNNSWFGSAVVVW